MTDRKTTERKTLREKEVKERCGWEQKGSFPMLYERSHLLLNSSSNFSHFLVIVLVILTLYE